MSSSVTDRYESHSHRSVAPGCNLTRVKLVPIIEGINWPTVIKPYPDSNHEMTVATLSGQIWLVDTSCRSRKRKLWLDISDRVGSFGRIGPSGLPYDERGLIGLEFDPQFQHNGHFYIYYSQISNRTTSPPVVPVNPCKRSTQQQRWSNHSLYSHQNILEEWRYHCGRPKFVRHLLRIKQPFHNNNGMNNIRWDDDRRSLLLITGDGGYLNDPFNLAQNLSYPHGKILSIVPSAISYPSYVEPIATLDELPSTVRRAIRVISSGIRNSHGICIYSPVGDEDRISSTSQVEYFLTHNGQNSQEGLFRYDPEANSQPTFRKSVINVGWSGWDNGQPTTTSASCSGLALHSSDLSSQVRSSDASVDISMIRPVTRVVSWNATSRSDSPITIRNGDSLRFLSTDGNFHNIYRVDNDTVNSWNIIERLRSDAQGLDYTYQPIVQNVATTLHFISSNYPETRLTVNVEPVNSVDSSLSLNAAAIQSSTSGADAGAAEDTGNIQVVTYPDRLSSNKLLPYFSYPHSAEQYSDVNYNRVTNLSDFTDSIVAASSSSNNYIKTKHGGHKRDDGRYDERHDGGGYYSSNDRADLAARSIYSGRSGTSRNERVLGTYKAGDDYHTTHREESRYAYDGADYGTFRETEEEVAAILGTRITGVALYTGGEGTTFGRGLIVSEWNRKIHNLLPSNKGHLFWVSLDPLSRVRYQHIQVVDSDHRPSYYVALGSNASNNRLYLGIYHSPYAGLLKLGAVVEVQPE